MGVKETRRGDEPRTGGHDLADRASGSDLPVMAQNFDDQLSKRRWRSDGVSETGAPSSRVVVAAQVCAAARAPCPRAREAPRA